MRIWTNTIANKTPKAATKAQNCEQKLDKNQKEIRIQVFENITSDQKKCIICSNYRLQKTNITISQCNITIS